MKTVNEAIEHPQFKALDKWTTINTPKGPFQVLKPVVKMDGSEERQLGGIPNVGEHTKDILKELGYSEKEINLLYKEGIVG